MNCVTTAAGRLGCWGREHPSWLFEGLAVLPARARMGCLAAESLEPQCAVVDAGVAGGLEVRTIDARSLSGLCGVLVGGGVRCWDRDGRARRVRGIRAAVEVVGDGRSGCARLQDGAVSCWHGRSAARLRADVSDAIDLDHDTSFVDACAVLRSGHVTCWHDTGPARQIADLSDAREVAVGRTLACARLADGGVACWDPSSGSAARRVPGAANIIELDVGDSYACARDRDDGLWCWGENGHFGLGDAQSFPFLTRPLRVPKIPPAVDVVLGSSDACARTSAGELWCWGRSFSVVEAQQPVPTLVADGVHSAALGREGLYAELEGGLHYRRLDQSQLFQHWPAPVGTTALAVSDGWACAIHEGALQCFRGGIQSAHYVTPGWLRPLSRARSVLPTDSAVVSLSVHGTRGCVAVANGRVLCWGEPFAGQREATATNNELLAVAGLPPVDAVAVGAGFACARTPAGELWCWGDATEGRLGDTTEDTTREPRRIVGLPAAAQVAGGAAHVCARTTTGELWCWGRNSQGQLGRGEVSPWSATPAPVRGLARVTAVALADDTTCVVVEDGGVECWGDNFGRHASPRGLLRADHAVPVDPSRLTWADAK